MTNYNLPYHNDIPLHEYSFLVTGGAGFIGSNLVEYLLKYGAGKVRVLDNFSTGSRENISGFFIHNNFELIEGDIRNYETCKKALAGIDYVFHEAALGSVPRSIEDPQTTNDVNITGFLNILLASSREKVKRLVYAASSSTYGDSQDMPKREDSIGKPLSPYAITKYVNELYAGVFADIFDLKTIGLRYFNVFGKRQSASGAYAAVIPKFVKQFMNYESPLINGDGTNSRDFTFIDNVVQVNLRAMLTTNDKAVNQVYNVACGEQTSLNELVTIIKKHLCEMDPLIENVHVVYGPARQGDVCHSLASIDKAKDLLHYNPIYNVAQGLEEAVQWYLQAHSIL